MVPDKTPNANDINLPLASLKPGTTITYFETIPPPEKSFWDTYTGKTETGERTPINRYTIKGDTAFLELYNTDATTVLKEQKILNNGYYKIVERKFLLGSDNLGRDMFSRLILGTRISLSVGVVSVVLSLFIGTLMGLLAGYFRGFADTSISWLMNVIWSLPTMLLVAAISFAMGKGFWQIFIAIGISSWVEVARVIRGQVFSLREKEYIQAAKVLGFGSWRIMFRHLLPNLKSTLIVLAVANFGSAILLEAGLSFLGLGVSPPAPSWGLMITEYNSKIMSTTTAYMAIVPGLAIMLLVVAFNFVGTALRDALDINIK